jgi:hypothetical protein
MRQHNSARTVVLQAWVRQGLYTTSPQSPNARRIATERGCTQHRLNQLLKLKQDFCLTTIHLDVDRVPNV